MLQPSKLGTGTDFHCFKAGIEPKWEDPKCTNGGKWTASPPRGTVGKGALDIFWLHTVLHLTFLSFCFVLCSFRPLNIFSCCSLVYSCQWFLGLWERTTVGNFWILETFWKNFVGRNSLNWDLWFWQWHWHSHFFSMLVENPVFGWSCWQWLGSNLMKVMKSVELWWVSGQDRTKFPSGQRLRQMKQLRSEWIPSVFLCALRFECG